MGSKYGYRHRRESSEYSSDSKIFYMKVSSIFSSNTLQRALLLVSNLTFAQSPTAMVASLPSSGPLRDVLIIGAGPGGVAAATGLARQLYSAVVFDSGVYRNALTQYMHNVPTWDHRNPKEFRAKAREDLLARYNTIHFENTTVESIQRTTKGYFEAMDTRGRSWTGRKVILATGVRDIFPEIENYSDVWVKGV